MTKTEDLMRRAMKGDLQFVMVIEEAPGKVTVCGNATPDKARELAKAVAADIDHRDDGELSPRN